MAQAILLKTDVVMTSNSSQNNVNNQAQDTGESKAPSFSSALDKQIDKQASQQHKDARKTDASEPKPVKSGDNGEQKSNIADDKSGKSLPDKVAESSEEAENDIVVTADISLSVATEEGESEEVKPEVANVDLPVINNDDEQKQEDVPGVNYQGAVTLSNEATDIKKKVAGQSRVQVTETSKPAIDVNILKEMAADSVNEEDVSLEKKQQVTSLRSDILNVLLKKPTTVSEKTASTIEQKTVSTLEQKLVTGLTLPSIKEGLSEEQKMMALANTVKSKGLPFTGVAPERSASVPSTITPAIIGANASVSSGVSSAQPTLDLQPGLKSEAWSRVLSSRVIWMAREGVQQASLKLNPANMGPVEVKLHMHNEQANISFIAQNAATRDALEQALPRLRESFQENGMELAHADVSQEGFSQADEQDNETNGNGSISAGGNTDDDTDADSQDVQVTEQDVELGLSVFA